MSEITKIRNLYWQYLNQGTPAGQRSCNQIAIDNFKWVLDVAYEAETKKEPQKKHTIADNCGAGDLGREGPCIFCEDFEKLEAQRDTLQDYHERLVKSLVIMSYFAGARTGDVFEDIARIFQRETGYLAPGKDCKRHSYDERCKIWNDWLQKKNCEAYQLLAEIESEGK